MKLIKYNQFIKESTEVTELKDVIDVLMERGKFYDVIIDINSVKLLNKQLRRRSGSSYSDFCKKEGANPEEDFLVIQNFVESKGFSLNKLKDIFSKDWDKECGYNLYDIYTGGRDQYGRSTCLNKEPFKRILNDFKSGYFPSTIRSPLVDYGMSQQAVLNTIVSPFTFRSGSEFDNAVVDIYLYFLLKKLEIDGTIWLGGKGWGDLFGYDNGDETYSEEFIRYKYGYHQTEYGKLWMEQCKIDEDLLRESAKKCLQEYLSDNLISIGNKLAKYKRDLTNLHFDDYAFIEEDRIIIDLKSLSNDINNSPKSNMRSTARGYEPPNIIDIENLSSYIIKDMSYFALDIELSYTGELVIWSEFDVNQ